MLVAEERMQPGAQLAPLVSVLIPAYNHEVYIGRCLDSVLADGYPNLELVDQQRFHLNRSFRGLYIPPMIWRELDNFS